MAFIGGISAGRCSLLVAKENQKGRRCPQGMKAPAGLLSRRPVCEANAACSAQQGHGDFDALDPRERGCTPLSTPKKKSKRKNASRFAQRIFFASPIWSRCATDGTVKYILYLLRDSRRLTAADTAARSAPLRGAVAQRLRGLLMAEHKKA